MARPKEYNSETELLAKRVPTNYKHEISKKFDKVLNDYRLVKQFDFGLIWNNKEIEVKGTYDEDKKSVKLKEVIYESNNIFINLNIGQVNDICEMIKFELFD